MACCSKCAQSKVGCGGNPRGEPWSQGCPPRVRTGGLFSDLTVTAADTAGKRLAKELGMFAILTSPAWILLLLLPKPPRSP